jgi:redox-sensitive bicupin YhaK (pirin superfamily)
MAESGEPPRVLRVAASQIELDDVSGRVLFPSPTQGPWLPFLRFADTRTLGGGDDPEGHTHVEEEVLNYILEGHAEYEDEAGHRSVLEPGSVELLSARDETRHKLVGLGQTEWMRWISIVVRGPLVPGGPTDRSPAAKGLAPRWADDVTAARFLVGPEGALSSGAGMECVDIEFQREGPCICPIGRERRAIAYVFAGSGTIDGLPTDPGVGALIDRANEITIAAKSGTRILLASAPRRMAAVP